MRPNVRRVVTGRMSRKFTVTHPATNDWQPAGVSNNRGVIYPADMDALQFAPEGTRLHDAIVVLAAQRMAFGDVVAWHGENWRVVHLQDFSDYGYYYAVAVRAAEPAGPDSGGFADA
ncbi:hypothetical protein [Pantoea agglomerans]|uniref:hypothetical protein n=1 Tax=Enterobacter agglomerans TaxID=549 RepID=UPI0010BFF257|nr:hypothetical protein [Pantoea agglomerans]MBD8145138.1 hypothetical protein [Pantoea agglomerans]MBD8183720.1 hypothetical protein [Pantoea agglomerans]MBD8223445.1 hypothetical protein [Pantoea agglomerans]TKK17225.1 hypothetical protein PagCFBP13516_16520 [Pantoea agglomerans]TKK27895.1 hypothetical protein PagCFBP13532_20505 [Pantoea agglomerans]